MDERGWAKSGRGSRRSFFRAVYFTLTEGAAVELQIDVLPV